MRKYNTKNKDYKEWLRLNRIDAEIPWTFEKTKEEAEIEKLLENPRFLKYQRFYDNPPKWYVNMFHRSDRKHNKRALKANIKMMRNPYDEHPMDDDNFEWKGDLSGWESEYINYRFQHRNVAKWWYW